MDWKIFFKKIGVREGITIDLIEEKTERQVFEKLHPEAKQYLTYLENTTAFPSIYHSYRYSGQHYIQNFTAIEFRSHLNGIDFSKFFWGKMIDSWEVFKQKCGNTTYYYRGGRDIVPSYVQYYVRNFPCIPCTDGKCYKSEDVFSPSLKSIIGTLMPVADLSTSITIEQAEFFGFKRIITVVECMALLDKLSTQTPSSDLNKQVFSIYNQLNSQSSSKDTHIQEKIAAWRNKGNVLAINNTFKPIKDLYTFSVHGTAVPVNSERFIKLPSLWSFDEMKAFSDLLSIPVITFDLLEFVPEGVEKEESLRVALIKRARFLAIIHSHNSNENYTQVITRLNTILKATQFFQGEELNLIYKLENGDLIFNSKIDAWSGEHFKFYFTGKWRSPLTLYGLSNSICALLDLKNMEREFGLILQLAEEEILQWLIEKGYEIKHLPDEELFTDINDNLHNLREIEQDYHKESPYTGLDIEIFIEKVKVSDIDYATVVPIVKEFTNISFATMKTYVPIESEQVRIDIGRWSEDYVFNYFKKNPQVYSSITWLNESEESYSPYDFEVIENGIKRYIEVKGTPSLSKEVFFLSSPEWEILFEHGNNYSVFRVFGAGTGTNRLERTDDLRTLISEGKLLSFPLQLSLP